MTQDRVKRLADVDDPEDSLVFEPYRAVDDRAQVELIDGARDRRAHLEAELADLAGRDGRRRGRGDPVVPQPVFVNLIQKSATCAGDMIR